MKKIRKVIFVVLMLSLLMQTTVAAQGNITPEEAAGQIEVSIQINNPLGLDMNNLHTGDEFSMTVSIKNPLDKLVEGTTHLVLRENLKDGKDTPVRLCTIPLAGNENASRDNSVDDVANEEDLQRLTVKQLAANSEMTVKVDCEVPENVEGQEISITATLAVESATQGPLGKAETKVKVANPNEREVRIMDVKFTDSDPSNLKKDQEFSVDFTVKNTGSTTLPYVFFEMFAMNDQNPSNGAMYDFGTFKSQTGLVVKDDRAYIQDMDPGKEITVSVRGKLPAEITSGNPYLGVSATGASSENLIPDTVLTTDRRSIKLTVAADTPVKPDNQNPSKPDNQNPGSQQTPGASANPAAGTTQTKPIAAKTGDTADLAVPVILMVLAVAVIAGRKVKRYE